MTSSPLFLLDTDISSYLIKRRYPEVQERFRQLPITAFHLSAISVSELLFGLQKLPAEHSLHTRVSAFIDTIQVVPWDLGAARSHAPLKYLLGDRGTMIGEMDLMIAAHAISLGATLVTHNLRHFERLQPELKIENWVTS